MTIMWTVLSVLCILALGGMQVFLNGRNVTFSIGQWVVYAVWLLWTLLGVALVWTFTSERTPRATRAARVSALILGGPAIIGAIILGMSWF
ncbi:MAG: hypothetical protein GY832_16795 [Chloroflexi bacterium]|nr:hypothetical protein [Chloroflexota bacterium]